LTGSPRVTNGEAEVTGSRIELQPKLVIVHGAGEQRVRVKLPEMPDLGYEAFVPGLQKNGVESPENEVRPEPTIVQSQLLRMSEGPEQTLFRFTEAVEVTATNLVATCERLDVIAIERKATAPEAAASEKLAVERIEAHDSVEVRQSGRTATSEKAFILPQEGKVVLEGNAVVNDDRGQVSGHRMTLLQGERRAIVEGGGPEGERARITLPAMPGREME